MEMSQSQSSQGARRIVSSSGARGTSKRGSSKAADKSRFSRPESGKLSSRNVEAEFLPEIPGAGTQRQSQMSAKQSATGMSVTSSKRARKAYELSGQGLADGIIEAASQRDNYPRSQLKVHEGEGTQSARAGHAQVSDRQRHDGGQIDQVEISIRPTLRAQAYATQPIDFHGVLSAPSNSNLGAASRRGSARGTGNPQRRESARLSKPQSSRAVAPTPKLNAWESFQVNQFKVRNQTPGQIIERLKILTARPLPFQGRLPPASQLDSTDALDSFLEAFQTIVDKRVPDFTDELKKGIHLATGTRTEYCEALLTFVCQHQKLEIAFQDTVEFFMESLESVVKLEDDNLRMKHKITELQQMKQQFTLWKYDLEKRLKEQLHRVDEITEREKETQGKSKMLEGQLADKKAECESLLYRLRHFEEHKERQEAGALATVGVAASTSGGAVPNLAEDKPIPTDEASKMSILKSLASASFDQQQQLLADLQATNKRLEEELAQTREALASKDQADHKHKIQDLFNKLQIENKNLRIYNQKCESKLTSKQSLIDHLEQKVRQIMVDKEEAVIQLKSEKVLLKNQLELNEEKYQSTLEEQQKRLAREFKDQYDDQIKSLQTNVSALEAQRTDLRSRLVRLQGEHEELALEFTKFRKDKELQEAARNAQYKALEDRITTQQQADAARNEELKSQISTLENRSEVAQKENSILKLRQKYLKQQTAALAKQKVFLSETLSKGREEIQTTLYKMEKAMMADNNNQAYLVSVEKCIKQATKMADMGTEALQNIAQILEFLKIEKLHQLLSDEDELEMLTADLLHQIREEGGGLPTLGEQLPGAQRAGRTNQSPRDADDRGALASASTPGPLAIQRVLARHGLADPVASAQPSPHKAPSGFQASPSSQPTPAVYQADLMAASEESQIRSHCVELAALALKLLADTLIQLRGGQDSGPDAVPLPLLTLLNACEQRADQGAEQELLSRYLASTKELIDSEIAALRRDQLALPESQRAVSRQRMQMSSLSSNNQPMHWENAGGSEASPGARDPPRGAGEDSLSKSPPGPRTPHEHAGLGTFAEAETLRIELSRLKSRLEEQKLKSRRVQLNLAGKIVLLEEELEQAALQKEEQIQQLEKAHREELQQMAAGVGQREAQLLQLCEEYREEARDLQFKLETSWKPAEESKTIQKLEKGARGNLYKLMREEYERLFQKNSELLANYQASIDAFVFLREDLRGSFALAFECERLDDGLLTMLNEPMLKYYLSKTFGLDKSKFRFLRSERLCEKKEENTGFSRRGRPGEILKLIIEVVAQDPAHTSQLFKKVKAQIKDGTSLLYDFMPLYFGMNLGSSGFSTHHCLKEFALLSKTGQVIDGEEFVVSVLRNKEKPLLFKVLAYNLELREEYMMELNESDIYELVEGDQQLLRNLEPDGLVKKIATNLSVLVRDKIKVLTCEQKIFFNEIWMRNMESAKHQQVHVRTPMEAQVYSVDPSSQQRLAQPLQSSLTHTAARTGQLARLQPKHVPAPAAFLERFSRSVECQTDFEISTLYEGFENVYRGVQKVGEVTHMRLSVQESTKTKTLVFIFDDLTSLQKLKFSLYLKAATDQYVLHSECMRIADNHHVLVSVEQVQTEGLLIKMFDLLECKAVRFSLLRKENGQFSKVDEETTLDLVEKQDFRSFVYELTYVADPEANEVLMQNMQFLFRENVSARRSAEQMEAEIEQKKQMDAIKRESAFKQQAAGKMLPKRKRAGQAVRLASFVQRAFYRDKWTGTKALLLLPGPGTPAPEPRSGGGITGFQRSHDSADGALQVDWRDCPSEKGALLYRNVFTVRCLFDGTAETSQDGIITLYFKDPNVNVEVCLYRELSRISIASTVHSFDLFGEDPTLIPFRERIALLNNMMERFFVMSEGPAYHMKVESDAVPIQAWLEEKRREASLKNPKENRAKEYDVIENAQAISEIQDDKERFATEPQGRRFVRLTNIEGEMHEVEMIFHKDPPSKKKDGGKSKGGGRQGKKASRYGKSQQEQAQMSIEQYLEAKCPEWDSVYFEITDKQSETVAALFDKRRISEMLAEDEYFDWESALAHVDPLFLEYIQRSLRVDKLKGEVRLHNKENVELNIIEKYRRVVGGKYVMRTDCDLKPDELRIVQKVMISNTEAEMCEFLYDIKIFQIQKIRNKDIVAYQLEIFSLSDPDVVYQYTYPMNFSAETQDPQTFVINIINLIEHPLKKEKEVKGQNSKLSDRTPLLGMSGAGMQPGGTGTAFVTASGLRVASDQPSVTADSPAKVASSPQTVLGIDNRLMLFVQETRFPRKIEFSITEPCSQLLWRQSIEPRLITTGVSSLHLVDQAIIEQLVALMLDENENPGLADEKVFEYEDDEVLDEDEDDRCDFVEFVQCWSKIKEIDEESEFVNGHCIIGTDLAISVSKRRKAFSISLYRPEFVQEGKEESEDEMEKIIPGALEFRVNPLAGDTQISKIVKESGLNYCVILVKQTGDHTIIKVVSLCPGMIKTRFKLHFLNCKGPENSETDMEGRSDLDVTTSLPPTNTIGASTSPTYVAQDLQSSTVDGLRRHYGTQAMEQALRIIQDAKRSIEQKKDLEYQPPTIFEKMLDDPPSVHQTRMINNYLRSLDHRTVVLHRKRFFDDQFEKLIIMAVQLKYQQQDQMQDQLLSDAELFEVILQEPETGQEALYQTAIQSFLTPEEFDAEFESGSLRSKTQLKRLARKLLEQRVEIRRISSMNQEDDFHNSENNMIEGNSKGDASAQRIGTEEPPIQENNLGRYTFEIVFNRQARLQNEMLDLDELDMSHSQRGVAIEDHADEIGARESDAQPSGDEDLQNQAEEFGSHNLSNPENPSVSA